MRVLDLADRLRKAGVKVVEHPGWRERGRSNLDPKVIVCHHTGPGTTEGLVQLCINGRADLPGPLSQVVLAPDGTAHVIASGTSNNAGPGGWKGFSGNSKTLAIEAIHPGDQTTPWPGAQLKAYYTVCGVMAAIAGTNESFVCAHREWAPGRKIDPSQLNMDLFRSLVADELRRITEVLPMFNPPLSIAAWTRVDYGGGGLVAVSPDGHIYAEPATLYIDAPASHPEYFAGHTPAVRIYSVPGGYEVEDHHGHRYKYVR